MKRLIALGILVTGVAYAGTVAFNVPSGAHCGKDTGGACYVVYDGTAPVYKLAWTWNGSTGTVQLTQFSSDGLTVFVYSAATTVNPRTGETDLVLMEPLGSSVSLTYTAHTGRWLVRSGHNYYEAATFVDSGSVTF